MKLYHQAGHNSVWNISSCMDDNTGDGIILSPVHMKSDKVIELTPELKQQCLFDPQFYIPDSQKSKLNSYAFFPEKYMDGFSTVDYSAIAYEIANACVNFQVENDFESIIIPARFYPDLLTNFIQIQKAFTVDPFLDCLDSLGTTKKVFITLPLTAPMVMGDDQFKTNLLNWITSYQDIDGIYLLINFNDQRKQVSDFKKLASYADFIQQAINADLDIICGYCNTEGLILSALDIYAVTMGAYENTRGFSIDKFLESDTIRQGPAPRLYFPKLLNWIRFETAEEIREDFPGFWDKIYTPTEYSERLFNSPKRPHFTKPELYKHHFKVIADQYEDLKKISDQETRIGLLENSIFIASDLYDQINKSGILIADPNCSGDHLPAWNRLLRKLKNSL